ncbi:hypothetical protein B0H16DRAFT_1504663 [Mycena metata]|uniref:Uncharacterized protein n=1 Tax=Mycena metata TaxID=1033252 RepID=A0AAD7NVU7_9AGAR|nr:hypothetical protein B0H16DRAFT_1504663 [Mycena metata]
MGTSSCGWDGNGERNERKESANTSLKISPLVRHVVTGTLSCGTSLEESASASLESASASVESANVSMKSANGTEGVQRLLWVVGCSTSLENALNASLEIHLAEKEFEKSPAIEVVQRLLWLVGEGNESANGTEGVQGSLWVVGCSTSLESDGSLESALNALLEIDLAEQEFDKSPAIEVVQGLLWVVGHKRLWVEEEHPTPVCQDVPSMDLEQGTPQGNPAAEQE